MLAGWVGDCIGDGGGFYNPKNTDLTCCLESPLWVSSPEPNRPILEEGHHHAGLQDRLPESRSPGRKTRGKSSVGDRPSPRSFPSSGPDIPGSGEDRTGRQVQVLLHNHLPHLLVLWPNRSSPVPLPSPGLMALGWRSASLVLALGSPWLT